MKPSNYGYCIECGDSRTVCDIKRESGFLACCPGCYVFWDTHRFMDPALARVVRLLAQIHEPRSLNTNWLTNPA